MLGLYRVVLGLYWGYIRVILGLYWGYIRVILGLYWGTAKARKLQSEDLRHLKPNPEKPLLGAQFGDLLFFS